MKHLFIILLLFLQVSPIFANVQFKHEVQLRFPSMPYPEYKARHDFIQFMRSWSKIIPYFKGRFIPIYEREQWAISAIISKTENQFEDYFPDKYRTTRLPANQIFFAITYLY